MVLKAARVRQRILETTGVTTAVGAVEAVAVRPGGRRRRGDGRGTASGPAGASGGAPGGHGPSEGSGASGSGDGTGLGHRLDRSDQSVRLMRDHLSQVLARFQYFSFLTTPDCGAQQW